MLEDAVGPPDADGVFFETSLLVSAQATSLDQAALLVDQWGKIGVELTLDPKDTAAFTEALNFPPAPYPDWDGAALQAAGTVADPLSSFARRFITGGLKNFTVWSNAEFDDLTYRAGRELNIAKQNVLLKEAGKILAVEFPLLPLTLNPARIYWWPWVKNYYGELTTTDDATMASLIKFMWIDEGLKEDMGY